MTPLFPARPGPPGSQSLPPKPLACHAPPSQRAKRGAAGPDLAGVASQALSAAGLEEDDEAPAAAAAAADGAAAARERAAAAARAAAVDAEAVSVAERQDGGSSLDEADEAEEGEGEEWFDAVAAFQEERALRKDMLLGLGAAGAQRAARARARALAPFHATARGCPACVSGERRQRRPALPRGRQPQSSRKLAHSCPSLLPAVSHGARCAPAPSSSYNPQSR